MLAISVEPVGAFFRFFDILSGRAKLESCEEDLSTCNSDLAMCNSDVGTCSSDLTTCNTDFGTCSTALGTCDSNLTACQAMPVCGDGIVDSAAGEECDVGLNNEPWDLNGMTCEDLGYLGGMLSCQAGCTFDTRACRKPIFVTSGTYTGDLVSEAGQLSACVGITDGLEAGDCICQHHGDNASSPITVPVKAWLSAGSDSPNSRFERSLAEYLVFAAPGLTALNYTDLTDGLLTVPLARDESGNLIADSNNVWTGTDSSGLPSSFGDCLGWESAAPDEAAAVGSSGESDQRWSESGFFFCNESKRLYCVGQ